MTIDDKLTERVRAALADAADVREVKMFGGIGFMLSGHMVAATSDRGLLVRVGPEASPKALSRPGAEPMVMNGRTMTGYIRVKGVGLEARQVRTWVRMARAFVETLPPKGKAARKKKALAKPRRKG